MGARANKRLLADAVRSKEQHALDMHGLRLMHRLRAERQNAILRDDTTHILHGRRWVDLCRQLGRAWFHAGCPVGGAAAGR